MSQGNRFSGKVVLITGGTSGIGRHTALLLAREGASVVAAGRNPEALASIGKELEASPGKGMSLKMDVTRDDQVKEGIAVVESRLGPVDLLINNAGVGYFRDAWEVDLERVKKVMDVNLYGAIRTTLAVLPSMQARKSGIIVNISSVAGKRGYPRLAPYCASKYALIGYSDAMRKDLEPLGIKVVVVCPPAVDTPFFDRAGYPTYREDHAGLPMMKPEDVAEGIVQAAFEGKDESLLSPRARILYTLSVLAPGALQFIQKNFKKPIPKATFQDVEPG